MAINFSEDNERIILEYTSETQSATWVEERLNSRGEHTFSNTFSVSKKDLLPIDRSDQEYGVRRFLIGHIREGYQSINKEVLGIKYDLLISNSIQLRKKLFVATKDISIFARIDALIDEQIIIGGDREEAIPEIEFAKLIKNFPTSTELRKYADARVAQDLNDYFETMSEAERRLVQYMNRTKKSDVIERKESVAIRTASELELEKYLFLRDELTRMLGSASGYRESQWQKVVANLFLLAFPQYIAVLEGVSVKEAYSNSSKLTNRKFDLVLVDANGGIDLIEIKKPSNNNLVSKRVYRDNYVPQRELSGSIMQAEKYLFYLNKAGRTIEREIGLKYAKQLPAGIEIKIASPKAIILSGRDNNLSAEQKFDLGFIRKKYSNIVDILSYDDLLRRINNIIDRLKARAGT